MEAIGKKERIPLEKAILAEELHSGASPLQRYRAKAFGGPGILPFLRYELATFLFGNMSGGAGYLMRKLSYARLLGASGTGIIFGKGIVLRHPGRIFLGDRVAIDDYAFIDAGGAGTEGVRIGSDVILCRNCVIQGKTGPIAIDDRADIGCNTIVSSVTGVAIGRAALIAGNCYIGGARYVTDRLDVSMLDQGVYSEGPIAIEDDVWLGAGVVVLDGIRIGKGAIVGAGAVVTKDIPEYSVAVGVPARVIGTRDGPAAPQ
jgi:acetyltransferase-like isoleucine patch superfamily enzyme